MVGTCDRKIRRGACNRIFRIKAKAQAELDKLCLADGDYQKKSRFLEAVMISCDAAIEYARRYARLALKEAEECTDPVRKRELLQIAQNCANVPEKGATGFYEACQSFLVCAAASAD